MVIVKRKIWKVSAWNLYLKKMYSAWGNKKKESTIYVYLFNQNLYTQTSLSLSFNKAKKNLLI